MNEWLSHIPMIFTIFSVFLYQRILFLKKIQTIIYISVFYLSETLKKKESITLNKLGIRDKYQILC